MEEKAKKYTGSIADAVAEHRRRMQLLKNLNVDALTGLAVREKLVKDAQKLLLEKPWVKYRVISMDIDNFKYINEMYGYAVGSQLLQKLAEFIKETASPSTLIARSVADKFLLFAPIHENQTTRAFWQSLDDRLQCALKEELGLPCRVDISVGIYDVEDLMLDFSIMIDYANIARSMGKGTTGFTCHFFTDDMAFVRANNNEITAAMVPAIQNEAFVLYYQPKVNINTGELVGAEALVRWLKDYDMLPPGDFIPLFEKNGFIETLDYYVLSHACRFLKNNPTLALPSLSVNISSVSMMQPKVVENILQIVTTQGVSPCQIDIEITETAFVGRTTVPQRLAELRQHGFSVSMDDFGTGVSSLNRLKNMKLDTLKIDREFIIDSIENPRGGKILSHVVNMANDLKLETVAEGIETAEQRDFLMEIGCEFGQGYYFARPMPEQDFIRYCTVKK